MTPPDDLLRTERRVTISIEQVMWHGSPVLTWMLAVVMWSAAIILGIGYLVR